MNQMPSQSGKLTAGDLETLKFYGICVHRDYAAAITALRAGHEPAARTARVATAHR